MCDEEGENGIFSKKSYGEQFHHKKSEIFVDKTKEV
jgi:hypothetical protein